MAIIRMITAAIIFLLSALQLLAQQQKLIEVLPEYRYSIGMLDNDAWPQPDFADSGWASGIRGDFPRSEWQGVGAFRYYLAIETMDTLISEVALAIAARGALEIFLNGKKIGALGRPGDVANEQLPERFHKLVTFSIENLDRHRPLTLAILYSNHGLRTAEWENFYPTFYFSTGTTDQLHRKRLKFVRGITANQFALLSICLAFTLLHFLMYLFYRELISNLFYALLTLFAALNIYAELQLHLTSGFPEHFFTMQIAHFSFTFFAIGLLLFIYSINYFRIPRQFYLFALLGSGIAIWLWWRPLAGGNFHFWFLLVVILEVLRTFLATRNAEKPLQGGWIIALGAGGLILAAIMQIAITTGLLPRLWEFSSFPAPYYGMLILMISMSILLARYFATINKDLSVQLLAVKELSEKNLAQERQARKAAIERERLEAENQRKTRELEQARQLQLSMLPKMVPDHPHWDIEVYMETATEVGGDYYDFYLDKDGTLTVTVGDATGHGLQAGIMVAATKSLYNALLRNDGITDIFRQTSAALKAMGLKGMFMASTIAKFAEKEMRVSAAGMPFTLVYDAASNSVKSVQLKAMPLGNFPNFPYKEESVTFNSGDVLVFMSDGLPEMFNNADEMLGESPIEKLLQKIGDADAKSIINALVKLGNDWADGRPQDDDVTLLVMKAK